ncbi:MAG: response regulator transcription factor [Rubrivivax sp.]|nr:MAG: response regulator transcription factor [Rubrivivax sp.]
MTQITVALVEDEPKMRDRLARVIAAAPSLCLAHAAATAGQLIDWFAENTVDVLLVDLGLPDQSGLDVIRRCRRLQPSCAVMVITIFGDEANMLQAFEAGATGYLLKDGTESDLASHVRSLHAGGSPMSPMIARRLLLRWQVGDGRPAGAAIRPAANAATTSVSMPEALSKRESQVLDLVGRGFTYPEISRQLGVSLTTVQTHVRNIYGKLDVHTKTEAVFEARQLGLLP